MPERFSPAQPNYLRFVSTPTIDIESKKISQLLLISFSHLWHIFHFVNEDNTCFPYLLIANLNYTILSFIEKWANPAIVVIVVVVVVEVAITKVHVPAVVLTVLTATPVPACGYCVYYLILN